MGNKVTNILELAPAVNPFPNMDERPCYKTYDQAIQHNGKMKQAGLYHHTFKGNGENPTQEDTWICTPLHVEAITTDQMDNNHGRLLRIQSSTGIWKEWVMPMELIAGDATEVIRALKNRGLVCSKFAEKQVVDYLNMAYTKNRLETTHTTGWNQGVFVLPHRVIGENSNKVLFQSNGQAEVYSQAGSLEGWKESIASFAKGNPNIMTAICTGFAGVLLKPLNHPGGGIHLYGDSSTGKTTALYAAASIWGGDSFRRTWRTTSNALEGTAKKHNDTLLVLDEIGEIKPKELNEAVYSLINGTGKGRADKQGELRELSKWRVFVFSTGEPTIVGHIESEGYTKAKVGQMIRVLDLPVEGKYGIFDELHGMANGSELSQAVKKSALQHYGHAGVAFVEHIIQHFAEGDALTSKLDIAKELLIQGKELSGQEIRAATTLAILATAGTIAIEACIVPWKQEELDDAIRLVFNRWKQERGAVGKNSEHTIILNQVRDFIDKHGESRFADLDERRELKEKLPTTHNRAGYTQMEGCKRIYMFSSSGLDDACKPFSTRRASRALLEAGAISLQPDNKGSKVVTLNGKSERLYFVDYSKLPTEE